jgi:SAM-dependent methyltransferase
MADNLMISLFSDPDQEFKEWSRWRVPADEERSLLTKYLVDKSQRIIEAGTGGGSISFFIEGMGFRNINAFDLSPRMIDAARNNASGANSKIVFDVADASDLRCYQNESFGYLVYMQQILCCVPESGFQQSLTEAYRIAGRGSIAIFSFLNWDARFLNPLLSAAVNLLRSIRKEEVSSQYLPLLRRNGSINWKYFSREQPTVYWAKMDEAVQKITRVGFSILETKLEEIEVFGMKGRGVGFYVVCSKNRE